jgi:hypothetical protein
VASRPLRLCGDCGASQEIGQRGAHISHPSARHRRYASIHSAPTGGGVGAEQTDAENDGGTAMTRGTRIMPATGAMSRIKLKLSLS